MPGPCITSARLVLTPLRLDDAPRLFDYRSKPAVRRFQYFEPTSVEDARAFIADCLAGVGGWRQYGIRLRDSSLLIGDVGFRVGDEAPTQAELGVTLAPDHWGRGLATEAVQALLGHVFGAEGVSRVFASVDPRNAASVALFERLGWRLETSSQRSVWFKGEWADDLVFATVRPEREEPGRSSPAGSE